MQGSPPRRKDAAEHEQMLRDLSALKVGYALAWAGRHGEPVSKAIRERTFLANLTPWHQGDAFDYPPAQPAQYQPWQEFLGAADELQLAGAGETEILALLPDPAPRVERDLAALHDPETGAGAQPSALRADLGDPPATDLPGVAPGQAHPRAVMFHIGNNRYPRSFMEQPQWLADDLIAMASAASAAGFDALFTISWLNDNPRWLGAFPASWTAHRGPAFEVGPHLGSWGQLLTGRLTVSRQVAARLREHWRLPYQMRTAWAPISEIVAYAQPRSSAATPSARST